jgi:AcrR family transcriptional regulator
MAASNEPRPPRPAAPLRPVRPIWDRPEPTARRPRFSRDQIAAAALAIADADGFEAVTMRRIAGALGAGTMSLYRYIETKDDLLSLIDDAILGEALAPGELPADWREAIALLARRSVRAYLNHPWAIQALQGRAGRGASAGPNGARHFEQSLAAVARSPLSPRARLDLLAIVDDYVYGHVLRAAELAERADSGTDLAGAFEAIQGRLPAAELPQLAALAADPAARPLADPGELDARFERGLRLIIDGAAAGLLITP